MKLLFVSQHFPYPPYSDGSRLIEYNLLKNISKLLKTNGILIILDGNLLKNGEKTITIKTSKDFRKYLKSVV